MNVLIIGGTGLISTRITRELLAAGHRLTVFNRGRAPLVAGDNVAQIIGDRTDAARFEAQMAEAGLFDCVIDMRCFTPAEAESAVRAFRGRTRQLIFCSTVDVYQKSAARYPVTEAEPLREGPGVF